MQLVLKVVAGGQPGGGNLGEHSFDKAGGVIGRHPQCDWFLPDPSLVLSSRHAQISHNGLGFIVTDTSTNGVYLNQTDTPLGRGNSAPLKDGDLIYLAHICLRVAFVDIPAGNLQAGDAVPANKASARVPETATRPAEMPRAATLLQPVALQPLAPPPKPSGGEANALRGGPSALMRRMAQGDSPMPAASAASAAVAPAREAMKAIPDDFDPLAGFGLPPALPTFPPLSPLSGPDLSGPDLPGLPIPGLPMPGLPMPGASSPRHVMPLPPMPLPPMAVMAPDMAPAEPRNRLPMAEPAPVLASAPPDRLRQRLAAIGITPARSPSRGEPDLEGLWSGLGIEAPVTANLPVETILKIVGRSLRTAIGVLTSLPVTSIEGEPTRHALDILPALMTEAIDSHEFAIENHLVDLGNAIRSQQDATAQAWADILASVLTDLDPEGLLASIRSAAPEAEDAEAKALAWDGMVERVKTLKEALAPATLVTPGPAQLQVEDDGAHPEQGVDDLPAGVPATPDPAVSEDEPAAPSPIGTMAMSATEAERRRVGHG